jgi:hypothetical protein
MKSVWRNRMPLLAATTFTLLAACATGPSQSNAPPRSERANAQTLTPQASAQAPSPPGTLEPGASPAWGFVDIDPSAPAADFVRSGEAYFLLLDDEWVRIWVGSPEAKPESGRVLVVRTPMVNGIPDATRDRETLMDLPLRGPPFMITGVLDSGSLAIQGGDGAGKRVGLNLDTFAFTPVEDARIRIDCGLLAATQCRAVMEAIGDVADNVNADILPTTCGAVVCASEPPSTFAVSVVLRSGEGDPTRVLTCVRRAPPDPVSCD